MGPLEFRKKHEIIAPRLRFRLLALALAIPVCDAGGQSAAADAYVRAGLTNAYSQRLQRIDLAQASARRREALSASLPSVSAFAMRTEASGNVLEFGQFVNPAYRALNEILGTAAFPTDTRFRLPVRSQSYVRLTQPLFAPAAWYGAVAATRAEDAERIGSDIASRQLAAEIRLAWLDWYKATSVLAVYDAASALVEEQVRISERLVQAGIGAPDAVLRARAEFSAVRQDMLQATQLGEVAGHRLNHLVARPLDTPVAGEGELQPVPIPPLDSVLRASHGREELRQLDAAGRVVDARRRAATSAFLPTLAVTLEYGFQGTDARMNGERDYTLFTILSQWNLFQYADRARSQQATLQRRSVAAQRDETASLIEMQVRVAHKAASAALGAIDAADDQLDAAERAFQLVRRRYEEGLALPMEVLDARRAFTAAAMNRVVTVADLHARRVELIRAAALEPEVQS